MNNNDTAVSGGVIDDVDVRDEGKNNVTGTEHVMPRKWNAIVGRPEGADAGDIDNAPMPVPQPNRRERSESLPCIGPSDHARFDGDRLPSLLEELEGPPTKTGEDDLSGNLYRAIWRTLDGTMLATSPVRSPVVADWKIVGSPSGSIQKITDPLEQLMEDEARLRDGSGSLSGIASVDRTRRMRSASVIGELLHSSSTTDLFFHSTAGSPVNGGSSSEEKRNGGVGTVCGGDNQVAQLPTMLHEDLGLADDADATEIFQRSSMDSLLDDLGEGVELPGSRSVMGSGTDYFKNITFGPLGSSVFASAGPMSASAVLESPPVGMNSGRRPSYLGVTDWPLSAGVIGSSGCELPFLEEPSVDDYFSSTTSLHRGPWMIPTGSSQTANRLSRRHSVVAPDTSLEEQFSQLGFGSSPKGSSPPSPAGSNYLHQHQHHHQHNNYHQRNSHYRTTSSGGMMMDYDFGMHGSNEHQQQQQSSYPPFQLNSYTGSLWAVEFKAGRTEIFYVLEADGAPQLSCKVGELVIVEADRGEDLGRVTAEISVATMRSCISGIGLGEEEDPNKISAELAGLLKSKEIVPKRIHRLAQAGDLKLLQAKAQEEALAMVRCQSRIRQKKLPMDVVDAEYQWDRNKLTFYFIADRRIDFRELVRDLFRIYKTRIWMCAVDKTSPRMINYLGGLVPVHADLACTGEEGDAAGAALGQED